MASEVTQQYLVGELSVRLAQLETAATNQASFHEIECLRREAEMEPVEGLEWVIVRALALSEDLCWDSLERGNVAAFAQQAEISSDLDEFGVCAGLL